MGAAPDLSEPQAFKNGPLLMMIDKTSTFRIFHKNLHHIQVFDVRYKWQNESDTLLLLPALASAHRWAQLTLKLAPLTAIPLIKKISFANANPITQIFC